MDQLLQQANQAGLNEQEGKDTLGGVFSLLQNKLGEEDFSKISQAIPGSDALAADHGNKLESSGGSSGGLMGTAMSMFGGGGQQAAGGDSSGGTQSITQLMGFLNQQGIDSKKIMAFLPSIAKYLQENAGVDTSALNVPGSSSSTGGGDSNEGGIAGQAASLFSSFGKK